MEEQKLPIHRGTVGFYDIRDLTLGSWKRMGAKGAFIELNGCGGLQGMYVIEMPGAGAITPEKHMYEEIFYVLEGRGTTEIWSADADKKQTFEWQPGSLFSPPLNTWHRIVNATSSPALLLGVTNAPPIFHLYRSPDALFNNPYQFKDRYDGSAEYFKAHTDLGKDPIHGRARNYGNIIPDGDRVELPLDGQRGVGHRTFFWNLSGNSYQGFIAQYAPGRYSRCHAHEAGPVLLCLAGKGYSITWPGEAGTTPWADGKGELVQRQDYKPGGIVSAAPGDAGWFHGHFGASKEPLRVLAFLGGYPRRVKGIPGVDWWGLNLDIKQGGHTIEYRDEDPHIRKMFQEQLAKEGADFNMPDEAYR
jgi:quercetin dioxygenase-like cupin family protein